MATVKNFEDLNIWKESRELCKELNEISLEVRSFKQDAALYNQIKRSSGSIMDNIAEGFERDNNKEFINFLLYSKGSCAETRSQLYRMVDNNYIGEELFEQLKNKTIALSKSISSMIRYLKNSEIKGYKFKEDTQIYKT